MANRTDPTAQNVHGTNPQFLIEKITRSKIYASIYWKEQCSALNAETLVDKAVELQYVAGTYGGSRKPAPFLCLILKMLQIQVEKEIVVEFIKNKDYKYVTALGCFYLRLTGKPEEVYSILEESFNDNRKLRYRNADGTYKIIHVDEFVDELLTSEVACDTVLPRIPKRNVSLFERLNCKILEDQGLLSMRVSALENQDEEEDELMAEIIGEGQDDQTGIMVGDKDLHENPKAVALREYLEENNHLKKDGSVSSKTSSVDREKEEEVKKKKHKKEKKEKKEKKKRKYRTRGSLSRSRSKSSRSRSYSRSKSGSRSRSDSSRSRSKDRKKKHSKWKKKLKEKRREERRDERDSRERDRRDDRKEERRDDKGKKDRSESPEKKLNENSVEYWIQLRAKLGMKPM